MLQIRSTHGFHATESRLKLATEQAGGSVLATTDMAAVLGKSETAAAMALTLCFTELYKPLLTSDVRFAAFLPVRVAICERQGGTFLESVSPRECCRILQRPDLESMAGQLEDRLKTVIENTAVASLLEPHAATEDMVNMQKTVPQRIDCLGTKIEDLAGTGDPDSQGG